MSTTQNRHIATIRQSADDWNYATINIGDVDSDDFVEVWVESSAHTFHEVEGVTELAAFSAERWLADIDAALADSGYTRTGDLQRAGDFVQTCEVVPS